MEYEALGALAALVVSHRSSPMYEDNPLSVRPENFGGVGEASTRGLRAASAAL